MTSQRQPLTVGAMFGRYRLDRMIGRGGMGEVYEAYDVRKGRTVAVKVLIEKLAHDAGYRERFQREADAAARLREPHVIPIHDYGEIDGRLYIDMRLVDGASLPSLLRDNGPMPPEQAVAVIRQIASALDAAHAQGLIHRDVKPDNILLTPEGFAYLVDFGIAHSSADDRLTTHGAVIGSFSYMAPERFRAEPITPVVDIYSLACVLYECLTGARPYPGSTDAAVISAHLFEPVPRPSMIRSGVTPALDAVIARGMAKDVYQRFHTAGELATGARASLTDSGVASARPVTGPQDAETVTSTPVPAPHRRRRWLLALTLFMAAVIAAGAVFGAWTVIGNDPGGTAVADISALRGADIELLNILSQTGRKRSTCYHENPDATSTTAVIFCPEHPVASESAARFFRFRTLNALRDYYATLVRTFQATSCPGDPVGSDGPSIVDGKEVGRKACVANRAEAPTAPKPSLLLTNEPELAMAFYIWAKPSDEPVRDYAATKSGLQFVSPEYARDPDYFTPEDRVVLSRLSANFGPGNCQHVAPPAHLVNATVACSTPVDFPSAVYYGSPDRQSAKTLYQADLGVLGGHTCGGTGLDDVWRKAGDAVGRFFCFLDGDAELGTRTCLLAMHEAAQLNSQFCTLPKEHPLPGPKTEAELLGWFEEHFG